MKLMKGIMMWSKFLNPEHAALKDEKTLHLLKDIIAAVPVQYIYLHHSFLADKTAQEMLIMVSFKHVHILNELTPVLNIIFNGQMEWSYRVFHVHEVEQALLQGSLFFTMPPPLKIVYSVYPKFSKRGRTEACGRSG